MKNILCYGDSNTFGQPPIRDLADAQPRYAPQDRWPGVLRDELGPQYHIIEAGLNGRTTVFDDPVEGYHKNGRTYLLPCLESAMPLDLVIIMLGTNDLKTRFSAPAFDIAWGASQLCSLVLNSQFGPGGRPPQVLLMAPARIGKLTAFADLWVGGVEKALLLRDHLEAFARSLHCGFLDAGAIVTTSDIDGIHFSAAEHHKLGRAVAQKVREML
ncbi:MAG: SGNH/GDSL hydrolase family protein [Anaerolineae bacterium]|nr:SGNH/GDSL hydrolase family protein [Anaerolineae bacterium]